MTEVILRFPRSMKRKPGTTQLANGLKLTGLLRTSRCHFHVHRTLIGPPLQLLFLLSFLRIVLAGIVLSIESVFINLLWSIRTEHAMALTSHSRELLVFLRTPAYWFQSAPKSLLHVLMILLSITRVCGLGDNAAPAGSVDKKNYGQVHKYCAVVNVN
jgi:hypothetical protein